jgi:hypothetical protein
MILIIASRTDQAAQMLAERWKDQDARVITCRDLSTAGWRFYADRPHASSLAVGNQLVAGSEVTAVLMRLPWITDDELPHIRPADRTYAAAEICAFLVAWLSKTAFPVINRPSPSCLMGPSWGHAQWTYNATRIGMRVRERHLKNQSEGLSNRESAGPFAVATVIRERCIGPVAPELAEQARRLARAAGVEMLTVQFSGPGEDAGFVQAFLSADVSQPEVADAILDCFHESAGINL